MGLQEFQPCPGTSSVQQHSIVDRQPHPRGSPAGGFGSGHPGGTAGRTPLHCFWCNQVGHRTVECPLPPIQQPSPRTPATGTKPKERARSTSEWPRSTTQTSTAETQSSAPDLQSSLGSGSLSPVVSDDSDKSKVYDPMVSDPIQPFIIPVTVQNMCTATVVHKQVLVHSGCTRCLIRRSVVDNLGLHTIPLHTPI